MVVMIICLCGSLSGNPRESPLRGDLSEEPVKASSCMSLFSQEAFLQVLLLLLRITCRTEDKGKDPDLICSYA